MDPLLPPVFSQDIARIKRDKLFLYRTFCYSSFSFSLTDFQLFCSRYRQHGGSHKIWNRRAKGLLLIDWPLENNRNAAFAEIICSDWLLLGFVFMWWKKVLLHSTFFSRLWKSFQDNSFDSSRNKSL